MRNIKTKIPHGSQGMTLVELLVVMAMLSVVMMAVISLYIPVAQSTAAQTQVSDVQDNLRLALKTMTRDLLNGGFLVANDPIAFPDATPNYTDENLTSRGTNNSQDFIIRTRAVGDGFARIATATTVSPFELTFPADGVVDEMIDNFSENSIVRLYETISGTEVNATAYTVTTVDKANKKISITPLNAAPNPILPETVMIRVKDASQPALQTIRYYLEDGTLKREVNGTVQILARNLDSVNFGYSPAGSSDRVKRVDIRLTGKTKAIKDDALSAEKTRSFETSVQLRNIQ